MELNFKKILLIVIFFIFFAWIFVHMQKDENERDKYRYETVCYVYKSESRRSLKQILVYYFFEDKKYDTFENVEESPQKYLNKYYKIILSSKDPTNAVVIYNQEIKDSLEIRKAGF